MKLLLLLLMLWVPVASSNNGPAAARVNGEEISEFRLERYFAEYLEDQGRAVASIRNPKAYKQLRQAALDELIDKELLWQEALKRGVQISDSTVQSQVEQTRQAMGGAEEIQARHILVKVAQNADAVTVEDARLRLEEMRVQIAQGADFASVARSGSEDASAS